MTEDFEFPNKRNKKCLHPHTLARTYLNHFYIFEKV